MTGNTSKEDEPLGDQLPLSRRTLFATFASIGLLGINGQTAVGGDADSEPNHTHLGQNWVSDEEDVDLENDDGLRVENSSTRGDGRGLVGRTNAPEGNALHGTAGDETGPNAGAVGLTHSSSGTGVRGYAAADSGDTRGVDGWTNSPDGSAVRGWARFEGDQSGSIAVYGRNESSRGIAVLGHARSDFGDTYGVEGRVDSDDGYGLYTPDDAKVDSTLEVEGDLEVQGSKNFVQAVDTPSGSAEVVYSAVEAGKAHTEANDVAEMKNGKATVELPHHFGMVTSDSEPLTVQVTPYASEQVHPQVVDQSTDRIIVEDFGDGPDDYTFAYTIKGVREGFEDEPVVRDP